MPNRSSRFFAAFLFATIAASPARAELGKLNASARVALAQARASDADPAALVTAGAGVSASGDLDVFIVGEATRAQLEAAGAVVRTQAGNVCTAYVPASAIEAVAALTGVRRIEGATRVEPQLDVSVPASGLIHGNAPEFLGLSGAGVLVGNVDTGIDYGHEDFKDPGGHTRLSGIWDQTDPIGPPPPGFFYGTEWTPEQIDAGAAREADTDGHGTHCMGILGGDGSGSGGTTPPFTYVGMAPLASLVAVKSNLRSTGIFDAANWFFQRAAALGMNGVFNISLGSQYGPHDGTSAIESGLSAIVGPGRVVCAAAGNARGSSSHAQVFATSTGAAATLYLQYSFLGEAFAIAGYYDSTEVIDVDVRGPGGSDYGWVTAGHSNAPYPGIDANAGRVYVENAITTYPSGAREIYIEARALQGQNAQGNWVISVRSVSKGAANGRVDLWRFYTNAPVANFYTGNQNHTLLVEPANAAGVISVGAWATKVGWMDCLGNANQYNPPFGEVGQLANFSSPGPTRDGRQKPDIAAPGCEVASATTFDIAQVCAPATATLLGDDMQHVINQGTSMASPHVAGAAALLMQIYGAVDPEFVKDYLFSNAVRDSNTGPGWNRDWGWGKLNIQALTIGVPPGPGAGAFTLAPIRPNPLRGDVLRLEFSLPREAAIAVSLVDVRGRLVARIAHGVHSAGAHAVTASVRGPARRLAAGLYFVTLDTPEGRVARRVIIAG